VFKIPSLVEGKGTSVYNFRVSVAKVSTGNAEVRFNMTVTQVLPIHSAFTEIIREETEAVHAG
jgi:hypothetical protein